MRRLLHTKRHPHPALCHIMTEKRHPSPVRLAPLLAPRKRNSPLDLHAISPLASALNRLGMAPFLPTYCFPALLRRKPVRETPVDPPVRMGAGRPPVRRDVFGGVDKGDQ